ncbi:hypothetical protein MIR68_000080 [Amoeboaphelidium protococcarum]|nr:hypothetical protein MIR68_000080 [Amoeboaphelidium protococcarum]
MSDSQKQQKDLKAPASKEEASKNLQKLTFIEEDDEFEEFPTQEWQQQSNGKNEVEQLSIWNNDWDDDEVEDDFTVQLRSEISKVKAK